MSKDTFKSFARIHPELATTVLNGGATWQQLYEIFEIYGENNAVWNQYFTGGEITNTAASFKDIFNTFKNLDMDSVQKGITNLQKTIGLLQDIGLGSKTTNTRPYEPRPLYQHFED